VKLLFFWSGAGQEEGGNRVIWVICVALENLPLPKKLVPLRRDTERAMIRHIE